MDYYYKKRRWKIILLFLAVCISIGSFLYTNWLVNKMAVEERKNVELWASATQNLVKIDINSNLEMTFLVDILKRNTTIPIIITDSLENILVSNNISYNDENKQNVLEREFKRMKESNEPIEIILTEDTRQYLYYRDSILLENLKLYPLVQLAVIFIFILIAYLAFSSSRKAEQNQVWVGMSKETAHQLGTPISSLMAWAELLKMQNIDELLIEEFEKDIFRLEKITERFSKIGSIPELIQTDLTEVISTTIEYLKTRSSNKVKYFLECENNAEFKIPLNASLFTWVIENLCKNAIDAMNGDGNIVLALKEKKDEVYIDISDTGKGISKAYFKSVFKPGFTTKKRGWGLGLSLAKRIVENYHKGKIFLKQSEINKGTTFRIILKK